MTNEELIERLPVEFKQLANREGISLLDREDWEPWYIFWIDGYTTAITKVGG